MGVVPVAATREEIIEAARKIYPEYPGIADSVIWEIGRDWCKSDLSGCQKCFLDSYCPKNALPVTPQNFQSREDSEIRFKAPEMKPGKYRPRFEEILRLSSECLPEGFRIRLTSSKSNAVIQSQDLPAGLHYEFNDWNNRISVEIDLNAEISPQFMTGLTSLIYRRPPELPVPEFVNQKNGWMRVQYFFTEDTPVADIIRAMNTLIKESFPVFSRPKS
jgi:hypothetical protein